MAEQSLPEPLNGEEIVVDLCEQIAEALRRDAKLRPHMAYENYGATVTIKLWAVDIGAKAEVTQVVSVGPEKPEGAVEQTIAASVAPAPPNEVRVRSGQPVPTLTKSASGKPTVKRVHYARPGKKASPKSGNGPGTGSNPPQPE